MLNSGLFKVKFTAQIFSNNFSAMNFNPVRKMHFLIKLYIDWAIMG